MADVSPLLAAFQTEFVHQVLAAPVPLRMVLRAPPGTGKSTTLIEVVRLLRSENASARVLVITAAKALQEQWRARLRHGGDVSVQVMDAPKLRELEAVASADDNPWGAYQTYVTTQAFLTRDERIGSVLEVEWDLVVVDDVQLHAAPSRRSPWWGAMWESSCVRRLVVTAGAALSAGSSPRVKADHGDVVEVPSLPQPPGTSRRIVSWSLESVLGPRAETPKRRLIVLHASLSASEQKFFAELHERLRQSETLPDGARQRVFGKALSSLYAADQMLQRKVVEREAPSLVDGEAGSERLPLSRDACSVLLGLLDQVERDSRWSACETWLKERFDRKMAPLVLFTESADTAVYLAGQIGDLGRSAVVLATGASSEVSVDDAEVVVAQTGALRGMELPFAAEVLHYDLPPSAAALGVRLTRFPLKGFASGTTQEHSVVVAEPFETESRIVEMYKTAVEQM